MESADILVSPRIKGKNTPMKIYSFLWSGKPVLVTNIESHTQVCTQEASFIAEPNPKAYADGMIALLDNESLRSRLGLQGKHLVETSFSEEQSMQTLNTLFDHIQTQTK